MTLAWEAFRRLYLCPPPRRSSLTRRPKSLSPQQPESARPLANTMGVISISSPTEGKQEKRGNYKLLPHRCGVYRAGKGWNGLPPATQCAHSLSIIALWCTPWVPYQTVSSRGQKLYLTHACRVSAQECPSHSKNMVSGVEGRGFLWKWQSIIKV